MLTTPHAVAGMALGALLVNPALVIPAAITGHFILDCVPHWQETLAPYIPTKKTYVRVPIDITCAIVLTILSAHLQPQHAMGIWVGAVFANIPDLDTLVVIVPKLRRGMLASYWDWHCRIQRETSSLWGVVTQLFVIALGVVVVYTA